MRILRRLPRYVAIAVLSILVLAGAGLAATQTGWFKNWLRQKAISQAAQYLNGDLTIRTLGGNLFTGITLDGVALRHEGQTAVAIERLTVSYSPVTMASEGVVFRSMILDAPTILLQRNEAGWNFNRFVKTRRGTGGRGAPPITMETITINGGHVTVIDRGRVVEDLSEFNTRFRFAYQKPGVSISIAEMSAAADGMRLRRLAGDLRFDRGTIVARDLSIETDRTRLTATVSYDGPRTRQLDIDFDAERLSLPEIGRYFRPLATIRLEPAVGVRAKGTLDELSMEVEVTSSAGTARGPLVGHFGKTPRNLEGRLDIESVNMAPILNRPAWKTRVTGVAEFRWRFSPARIAFEFAGPQVEGYGYQAAKVRADGVYEPGLLRFNATGVAYGATATTSAVFRFATPARPLAYMLDGDFRDLDVRLLPDSVPMPDLETQAAGKYRFEADGPDWRGSAELDATIVEGARFDPGTQLEIESRSRRLGYSASGTVARLNPRRFAAPLEATWLDDGRFEGVLNGSFTFEGSGRTVDDLVLGTKASLLDSSLTGARFPSASVELEMAGRQIRTRFQGLFEELSGSLFTERKELAGTVLNGSADMAVSLVLPKTGPTELLDVNGTANLKTSTIAGLAIESGTATGSFANRTVDIKELSLSGPEVRAVAAGVLAFGDAGESRLDYDIAVTNLDLLAGRFNQALAGSAHVIGRASGPAAKPAFAGTLGANRLRYGTTAEGLTVNSKYVVQLPHFDIDQGRVEADSVATFVTVAGWNFMRVAAKTIYEADELQFDTMLEEDRRSLGLGGKVVFRPDHGEVHLRALNLTVGQTEWSLPTGQEATARYSNDVVTIEDFVLQRGSQKLTAAGTLAVGANSASLANSLDVRLDNVQVRDVNELLLGNRALSGTLNATAAIRGTRLDPTVESDFAITAGTVEGVDFGALTGRATYSGRAVDLDARLEQTPAAVLTAVGTVPIPGGPGSTARTAELDLAVKSTAIDLGLFQPATTQVTKLTGQFSADVHAGGTFEAPRLDGRVETTNAGFAVAATGVVYTNAIARLLFEGDRLVLDRVEVSDGDRDRLVAIGELGIVRRAVGTMNVQVSASQFRVLDNELGEIEVDSDLRLTGDASNPTVTGSVVSRAGRLEVDQILERLSRSSYRMEATETGSDVGTSTGVGPRAGLYDAATIDVRLRLPDDVLLRGRDMHASFSRIGLGDMNITVGGEIQIRKAPAGRPDLVGTISVVRGFYDFQGRRFEVLRDSQVRFQGTRPIDPALQVDAQRVISGVTAVVNIRGTAREPQVRLSSRPPLDEADVLSLILFNQPINQLGAGERMNLAEQAGNLAVGYLASPLANSIARALDLDVFEIRTTGGENGKPTIAVGQQFGSRLFVSFQQEFGSVDFSRLSLEYRISELLRLVSSVTQGSQRTHRTQRIDTTGVDLIYTIAY